MTRRWVGHQSCYSSKVLPSVVNIETAASEINKKELVQSQIAEHLCMSFYGIFQAFRAYYYCLQSLFYQSFLGLIFAGMKWKCSWISVLLGLIFPGLERGIFLHLKKTVFIIDAWPRKFFSQYSAFPRVSFATILQVFNFITKRLQNRCFLWNLCVFCEIFKNSFWILFWFPS